MTRTGRIVTFLATTFSVLILLGTLIAAYFLPRGNVDTLIKTLSITIFDVPLAVYLIILAIFAGLVAAGAAFFSERRIYNRLRLKLQKLVGQQFQDPIFHSESPETALDADIETLRQRLIKLQQEVQNYSDQPIDVKGQTKEQILEEERHRLARELHDSVSQQLFAAMLMLSALKETAQKNSNDPKFLKTVTTIEGVINEAQSEMRALLLHLRPTNLEGKSLREGIESLVRELQTKIHIEISADLDDVHLPTGVEDNLFRIVQELFSNTLRHAKAKHIDIYLKKLNQVILLKVVDDGVGFDLKKVQETGSYGINNIKERAAGIGGTFKLISFPNKGTSAEIRIPVIKEQ